MFVCATSNGGTPGRPTRPPCQAAEYMAKARAPGREQQMASLTTRTELIGIFVQARSVAKVAPPSHTKKYKSLREKKRSLKK